MARCLQLVGILCCWIILAWSAQAQPPAIDSLLASAYDLPADTNRALILLQASDKLISQHPERAVAVTQQVLELSRDLGFLQGELHSLTNLSSIYIRQGKYDRALEYTDALLDRADEGEAFDIRIKALNRLAVIYYYQGAYQAGIETNFRILQLLEQEPQHPSRLYAFNNIGINYERLEEADRAYDYYAKALEIAEREESLYNLAAISGNMGVIKLNAGVLPEASRLFKHSIQAARKLDNQILLIDMLFNLGEVYMQNTKLDSAILLNRELGEIAKSISASNGEIKAYSQRGRIHYIQGAYRDAIRDMEQSLQIADSLGDEEERITILDYLQRCYREIGDYPTAYKYLQKYAAQKDTVYNLEKTKAMQQMQVQYDVGEKEKTLLEQQLELERRNRERTHWIAGVILLFLLGAITIWTLRKIMYDRQQLAQQRQALQEEQISSLKKENKILALDAMITGQEEERKRIARDLHDGLGSLLATVKGHFQALMVNNSTNSQDLYRKTDVLIDQACVSVRNIAHDMMPRALTDHGLAEAVDDLVAEFSDAHRLKVDLDIKGLETGTADPTTEVMIYRIIQELLQNISRHANAGEVLVQLLADDNTLHITVEDDGIGFDPSTIDLQKGIGLSSIRTRVEYLNGEFSIDAAPGRGSTIIINVPKAPEHVQI